MPNCKLYLAGARKLFLLKFITFQDAQKLKVVRLLCFTRAAKFNYRNYKLITNFFQNYDFGESKFMKNAQKTFPNDDKSCQSRLLFAAISI